MNYRNLGRSGLKVSEISLGSWMTYGGYVDKNKAIHTIDLAYRSGINFFDTANIYTRGEAEKLLGQVLTQYPRSSYVIATKVWGKMGNGPNDRGLSRKHIMEQCEKSIQRLGTDYIDLYYCHSFDADTPMEETLRALDDLVRQGKVLYIGVSNWTAVQITEAVQLADQNLLDRIIASQTPYNILNREIETEIIPQCSKWGIGQVVYSPLAQGVLSGKYSTVNDRSDGTRAKHAKGRTQYFDTYLTETNLSIVAELKRIAGQLDVSLTQLALAWILRMENISSAIIGASSPEQLEQNVKASTIALENEVFHEIERVLS